MELARPSPGPVALRSQAIAKADAVTGNAARLVRGAHAGPMHGAGATADTDRPCPKARARLDRRRARVPTPLRRVSRLTPRQCDTSPGESYGTPGADTAATRRHIEAECPQRVPFRTEHLLGVVVNWPSVGLSDDFCAPCWSVRRIPTHGRLTPCGN